MRRGWLLACLVAVGCEEGAARTPASERTAAPVEAGGASALRPYSRSTVDPPPGTARNPFEFASRSTPAAQDGEALPPLPPPEGLPELPLPLAQPPLRLLGVVTAEDGGRVAVLNVGADLVLARVGDRVAGRFSVTAIGEEAVELTDSLSPAAPVRLALP